MGKWSGYTDITEISGTETFLVLQGGSIKEISWANIRKAPGAMGNDTPFAAYCSTISVDDSATMKDDIPLKFGTDGDFKWLYNTTSGKLELQDVDGNVALSVLDNGTDFVVYFNGNLLINAAASATVPIFAKSNDSDTGWGSAGDDIFSGIAGGVEAIRFDADTTAGNTRFMLRDNDTGALVRVSVGAADSGGTGYKLLRIPN